MKASDASAAAVPVTPGDVGENVSYSNVLAEQFDAPLFSATVEPGSAVAASTIANGGMPAASIPLSVTHQLPVTLPAATATWDETVALPAFVTSA